MGIGKVVNSVLIPLGAKLSRVSDADETVPYRQQYDLQPDELDGLDRETRKVLNVIGYTKQSGTQYSADVYDSAYHSIELRGVTFTGQRKPKERLDAVPFDFSNATVLDIGCNQGGMIFELADKIRHGVGIDYDSRMINAANRLRSYRKSGNTDFFVFDLENEDLNIIENLLPEGGVDIIFLLSVCMWIENWRSVIDKAAKLSDNLLFETNGKPEEQEEQESYLRKVYGDVAMIRDSSPDDLTQKSRKLIFCKK